MNIEDVIAQKVEAARRRIATDRDRRERQQRARSAGLAVRHAAKLRNLSVSNATPCPSGGPA